MHSFSTHKGLAYLKLTGNILHLINLLKLVRFLFCKEFENHWHQIFIKKSFLIGIKTLGKISAIVLLGPSPHKKEAKYLCFYSISKFPSPNYSMHW